MRELQDAADVEGAPAVAVRATGRCTRCRKLPLSGDLLVPCGHAALCSDCHVYLRDDVFARRSARIEAHDAVDGPWPTFACPLCDVTVDDQGDRKSGGRAVRSEFEAWQAAGMPGVTIWRDGAVGPQDAMLLRLYDLQPDGEGGAVPLVVAPVRKVGEMPVEKDAAWLATFGRSIFIELRCEGAWEVFRHLESATPYYVQASTGLHTWDMPPEVAAEMQTSSLTANALLSDEYAFEGLGVDFESNGSWVPPSVERALRYREKEVFAGGSTPCCVAKDDDFAQLGTGVALYFRLLSSLSALFAVMTVLALPSLALYYSGARMISSVSNPMMVGKLTLGNVGPLGWDTIQALETQAALAALSNETVTGNATASGEAMDGLTYFTVPVIGYAIDGRLAAYIITGCDILACLIAVVVSFRLQRYITQFEGFAERKKVTAADYTIYVRGLPQDATMEEIRDHFNALFRLDGKGVTVAGTWDPAMRERPPQKRVDEAVTVAELPAAQPAGITAPASESVEMPPAQLKAEPPLPAEEVKHVEEAVAVAELPAAEPPAAPQSYSTALAPVTIGNCEAIPTAHGHDARALGKAADNAKRALEKRRKVGVISDADGDVSFAHRLEVMSSGVVRNTAYCGHPDFMGSWVADVHVVRPTSTTIRAYLAAQKLTQRLRIARARTKMCAAGYHNNKSGNNAARAEAMREVDKLGTALASVTDRLKRRNADATSKCAGSAFVTFNCEESYQRALKAYSSSSNTFLRRFQAPYLRFRNPGAPGLHLHGSGTGTTTHLARGQYTEAGSVDAKAWRNDKWTRYGRGHALWVESAPDPSDVVHENLEVTSSSRGIRSCLTSIAALLLVIGGLVVMVVAQSYSQSLAGTQPDLSMCALELPALFLGGYDNASAASTAIYQGYGASRSWTSENGPRQLSEAWMGSARRSLAASMPSLKPGSTKVTSSGDIVNVMPSENAAASFTRLSDGSGRAAEDAQCGSGRYSLAVRYDFRDVDAAMQAKLPSLHVTRTASTNVAFGTAATYGSLAAAATCTLATQRTLTKSVAPTSTLIPTDPACPDPRLITAGSGYCPCVPATGDAKCSTLPCYRPELASTEHKCKTFSVSTLVGCYCSTSLAAYVEADSTDGLVNFINGEQDVCGAFISQYAQAQGTIVAAGVTASLVNVILGLVLPLLTLMEGHVSLSALSRAMAIKLGVAQAVNTALTVLLVNARVPDGVRDTVPTIVREVGILDGLFGDFTTPWYGTVGTTIFTTALSNTLVPPILMSIEYFSDAITRCSALRRVGNVATQAEMDELFVGARFDVASRYPVIMTTMILAIVYSVGVPLLLPLASLAFALQYSVDKAMILCFYRKPPAYDASLARITVSVIPYAILLHIAFSIWMLSAPNVLPSETVSNSLVIGLFSSAGSAGAMAGRIAADALDAAIEAAGERDELGILPRFLRLNTFPYVLLFALLAAFLLVTNVISTLLSILYALMKALTCGFICCKRGDAEVGLGQANGRRSSSAKVGDESTLLAPARLTAIAWGRHLRTFNGFVNRLTALGIKETSVPAGLLFESLWATLARSLPGRGIASGTAVSVDGQTRAKGKGLSHFSAEFSRIHDAGVNSSSLSFSDVAQGWRLQAVDAATMECANGQEGALHRATLLAAAVVGIHPKGVPDAVLRVPGQREDESKEDTASRPPATTLLLSSLREAARNPFARFFPISSDAKQPARMVEGSMLSLGGEGEEQAAGPPEKAATTGCCCCRRSLHPLVYILRKVWGSSVPSTADEAGHAAGSAKRTWEVIADSGLTSYDLMRNPRYRTAFLAAAESEGGLPPPEDRKEEEEEEEDEEGCDEVNKGMPAKSEPSQRVREWASDRVDDVSGAVQNLNRVAVGTAVAATAIAIVQ